MGPGAGTQREPRWLGLDTGAVSPRQWVSPPSSMGRTSKPAPLLTPGCSRLFPTPCEAAGGVGTSRAGAGRWWQGADLPSTPLIPAGCCPWDLPFLPDVFSPGKLQISPLSTVWGGGLGVFKEPPAWRGRLPRKFPARRMLVLISWGVSQPSSCRGVLCVWMDLTWLGMGGILQPQLPVGM